jgi:ribonuclease HI
MNMKKEKRPVVDMHTDGSFKGKPKVGGYAGVMVSGNHVMAFVGRDEKAKDNDHMELQALVSGLRQINTPARVNITSDSKYVVNGVNSWLSNWKRNGWKTANGKEIANKELWQEVADMKNTHIVKAEWVKGHKDNPTTHQEVANDVCDGLAQLAADGKIEF